MCVPFRLNKSFWLFCWGFGERSTVVIFSWNKEIWETVGMRTTVALHRNIFSTLTQARCRLYSHLITLLPLNKEFSIIFVHFDSGNNWYVKGWKSKCLLFTESCYLAVIFSDVCPNKYDTSKLHLVVSHLCWKKFALWLCAPRKFSVHPLHWTGGSKRLQWELETFGLGSQPVWASAKSVSFNSSAGYLKP